MSTYYYTNPETEEIEDDSSASQTDVEPVEPDADPVELILRAEHPHAAYKGTALAKMFGVSETSIRKVFNGLKQGLSEDFLKGDKGYTELARQLIEQYYGRPETQSAAEWLHAFIDTARSLHDSGISMKPGSELAKVADEHKKASMLAKRDNLTALAKLRGYQVDVEENEEAAFEAELDSIRQREYDREIRRRLAVLEAREQVAADLREAPKKED